MASQEVKDKVDEMILFYEPLMGWLSSTLARDSARQVAIHTCNLILEATKTEIDRPELCKTIYDPFWLEVKKELESFYSNPLPHK